MPIDLPDYSLSRVIQGIYDGEYYTVATDEDGNIIGVFKGEYNEELITIKTDSAGRMLAIITDPEDVYGNIHMVGNAELAARLGSIQTFDRRGEILWMDDFEDLLGKWNTGTHGTGASVAISTAAAATRSSSVKLTTGSSGSFLARIYMYRALPVVGKLGFEVSFTFDDDMDYILLYARIRKGTAIYYPEITLDHANDKIIYNDSAGNPQDLLTSVSWQHESYNWSTLKFVVDYENEKYARLIFRDTETPMSSIALQKTALGGSEQRIELMIQAIGTNEKNAVCYVDNVIITQNEP